MTLARSLLTAAALTAVSAVTANATIVTIFDGIVDGRTSFNNTVAAAGGVVSNDVWSGLGFGSSIDRGAYTITRNNGGSLGATSYGTMSGEVLDISPAGGGSFPRTDPLDYFASGVTLTFASAVNSIGFEVGDWATCCFDPTTDLFISFDGGLPILVASSSDGSNARFPTQSGGGYDVNEIFVAAFDDTGDFTSVSFWGNGIGEYLVFGGDVRYALLDEGTLPPDPSAVPLPAGGLLLLGALGSVAALRRRKLG